MSSPAPLLYVILGAVGSDRRAVVADWILEGLEADERPLALFAASEPDAAVGWTASPAATWTLSGESVEVPSGLPEGVTHVFFFTDGRGNPVDQLEALHPWWRTSGCELARVYTFVNCTYAAAHPELALWYDACIHYSDAVLLARREGVANKWLSDFRTRYEKQYFPCLFEFVKEGRVKNPPLLLEPQARRMSHFFDEVEDIPLDDPDFAMGTEEDEETTAEDLPDDPVAEVDPWMERRQGGRRVIELPDLRRLLS